jgi:phosphatidylglycerol:prolipoprotein diacylglycerol transferase
MILIKPSIDPVILSMGIFDIRWYSLAYIAGFIIGSIIIKYLNKKLLNILSNKQIDSFFIWSILGVIIGGRVGYVLFYQTSYLFTNPIYILKIWTGGMSFHGGLIGIIISMYLFCKKNNIQFFFLSDLVSIVAPIGLFFGRIANFINNELYGKITNFPFAMIYPEIDLQPRHPSQLYEAFLEGIILFVILLTYFNKTKSDPTIGKISGLFLILYGTFRILIEFLREPDSHIGLIFNIASMGQILSIPLIIMGVIFFKKS